MPRHVDRLKLGDGHIAGGGARPAVRQVVLMAVGWWWVWVWGGESSTGGCYMHAIDDFCRGVTCMLLIVKGGGASPADNTQALHIGARPGLPKHNYRLCVCV